MSEVDASRASGTKWRSADEPAEQDACTASRADEERAAEARRNEWLASGSTGMSSKSATSTTGAAPAMSEPTYIETMRARNARVAEHTSKLDRPLEDDVVGNMIPGLVAGGLVAGLQAAATGGARTVIGHVAKHTAEHVVADGIEHGAHAAGHAVSRGLQQAASRQASPTESAATSSPAPIGAGMSSDRATSSPAVEPNRSEAPDPRGQDRVPYAPGEAPLRVPEAPSAALAPPTFVVRG